MSPRPKKTNLHKNQNQKVTPYDYNRVVLQTVDREPDSDYINASYIDSILKPNAYIVTQGPTEETVASFWRMIWQERAAAIVMLTKTFDFIKVVVEERFFLQFHYTQWHSHTCPFSKEPCYGSEDE